jgi:hypothetical protein
VNLPDKARFHVYNYVKVHLEKTDTHVTFGPDEVYVVWFAYVLGGWKALCSTTLPDGMYYEVTHDKNTGETYLDAYKKFENVVIVDADLADVVVATSPGGIPIGGEHGRKCQNKPHPHGNLCHSTCPSCHGLAIY